MKQRQQRQQRTKVVRDRLQESARSGFRRGCRRFFLVRHQDDKLLDVVFPDDRFQDIDVENGRQLRRLLDHERIVRAVDHGRLTSVSQTLLWRAANSLILASRSLSRFLI